MKKRLVSFFLLAVFLFCLAPSAFADTLYGPKEGAEDWVVSFNGKNPLDSNFSMQDFSDVLEGMEPGDDCILTVHVINKYTATTDWYIENDVIKSLEDHVTVASGGGYTYRLAYTSNQTGKETVYFDSTAVGGENTAGGEGLNQAATDMANFRFMDTLAQGESGIVTLKVALDGMTQGNDYQDTLAQLSLSFATMLREDGTRSTPNPRTIVRTGDESDLFLYIGVFGVSGLFVLLLAIYALTYNNRKKKKGEEKK